MRHHVIIRIFWTNDFKKDTEESQEDSEMWGLKRRRETRVSRRYSIFKMMVCLKLRHLRRGLEYAFESWAILIARFRKLVADDAIRTHQKNAWIGYTIGT